MALKEIKCGVCGKPDKSFVHCDLISGLACMKCCDKCKYFRVFEGVTRCSYPVNQGNKKSD
nr:MAG TPA: hypothetical protein [Caudoviricetes sp.]